MHFRQVRGAMEIALFIQNLQEERAEVALFIFTKQSAGASFNLTALRTNKRFVDNLTLFFNSLIQWIF